MIKQGLLALAASASVFAAAAPVPAEARHHYRHYYSRVYQGSSGRYSCRQGDGVQGTLIGAGAGALLGSVLTHGAVGPILGAVGGGLAGNSIGRHSVHCR